MNLSEGSLCCFRKAVGIEKVAAGTQAESELMRLASWCLALLPLRLG